MKTSFVFEPYIGPKPLKFGMTSDQVNAILGKPSRTRVRPGGGIKAMYKQGEETAIIAFYDPQDHLSEAMFLPVPKFELWFHDHNLLTEPDLIKFLKMFDPAPSIEVGAAVFFQIGIATDADPPTADTKEVDRTVNCFVKGTFGDPKTAP